MSTYGNPSDETKSRNSPSQSSTSDKKGQTDEPNLEHPEAANCSVIELDLMMRSLINIVQREHQLKREGVVDRMKRNADSEESFRKAKEMHEVEFRLIRNDPDVIHDQCEVAWLSQLAELYTLELNNIKPEYISRYVYSRHHSNQNGSVFGGICYRSFPTQPFVEISFVAIADGMKTRGYGTVMMNLLKDLLVEDGIYYVIMYADHNALPYYSRQGFVEVDIPKSAYQGFIKDYIESNLVGCRLDTRIKYEDFNLVVRNIGDLHAVMGEETKVSEDKKEYESIEPLLQQKGGIIKITDIPGLWHLKKYSVPLKKDSTSDRKMASILKKLTYSEHSWPFLEPVKREKVPARATMHERLFIADLIKIFRNCYFFNDESTVFYNAGQELNNLALQLCSDDFPNSDLLRTLQTLEHTSKPKRPIVVHCSDGIGRTGSVVLIQPILDTIKAGQEVDYCDKMLIKLREQRNNVQTDHQYLFVHQVMLNYFMEWKFLDASAKPRLEKFTKDYDKIVIQN